MDNIGGVERVGCGRCWPASADAAWDFRQALVCEGELIDESHFHVMIFVCPYCSQPFVSIFTETVDWADGEDPQYWCVLPITRAEAADLWQRRRSVTEADLTLLGSGRASLHRNCPKREAPSSHWGVGISIGGHD
jgi:hypothetical protein